MFEFLRQIATGLAETWRRLSLNARVQIALAAVFTLAILGLVVYIGAQPQFVRLYGGLDPAEANEVVVWLDSNGIRYRLRDGGQTVDVPVQEVQRARIGLAQQNLPRTQGFVPGFELFDRRDLMTNRWLQDIDFMRAVQGELQRQLNQFNFVRQSSVFIREAPPRLFTSEQQPSQATVTLDVTRALSPQEVKAVLQTVSSFGGVNLSTNNIAIATTDGVILHSPSEDKFAALAADQYAQQVTIEQHRAESIQRAFKDIGVNAVVRVSAVMDWTSEEKTEKQVTAGVPISLLDSKTETTENQAPPVGAPGAAANVPDAAVGLGQKTTISKTTELVENYDNSESLTKTKTEPGQVRQYYVSAFIEGSYDAEGNYTGLTPQQVDNYKAFITNAVGKGTLPTEIEVFDQAFRIDGRAAEPAPVAATFGLPWYEQPMIKWGIQGALIIAAFFVIRLFMRRAMVMPAVEEEEVVEIPEASPEDRRRMEVAQEVERLSREEPAAVAALLRSWLAEEE